ncbi:MAG: hypothetical protein NPMRTH1_1210022 [Nitrosopumilales archaeon]|nr:MAG: hypothetical protein NPMRTH1_1210022 [Nitrosopumilales archaeon]
MSEIHGQNLLSHWYNAKYLTTIILIMRITSELEYDRISNSYENHWRDLNHYKG